jgi:Uma2 family endonuclease
MTLVPLGREATLDDLWEVDGPAELIDGEIVPMTPIFSLVGRATSMIWRSLNAHERHHPGYALQEPVGYVLHTPGEQMLIPDVSWWSGELSGRRMLDGAPTLAVEVRSESDYGPSAERSMAVKRSLYFAGGTEVVWDVDVLREQVIRVYRAGDPEAPAVYRRGELAEAEPAVPGWRFPVDELFD